MELGFVPVHRRSRTLLHDLIFADFGLSHDTRTFFAVIELGAGAALPSLVASILPSAQAPSLVVVTDYPDPGILGNLQNNVTRNQHAVTQECELKCAGYEWGTDIEPTVSVQRLFPIRIQHI